MYYARLCFLTGRIKKAAWHYLRAGELRSDDPHSVMLATMCHRDLGEITQMESGARACAARARAELAHRPDNATAAFQCAIAHAMLGEREPALAMVERALSLGGDDLIVQYNVACVQSLLGNLEGAMDRLEVLMPQASQHRKEWLRRDRDLAPLHGEPRFIALLRTYGVALPSETT